MSVLPHVFSSSYSFTDADDADDANAVYDDAKVYSDAVQCIRVQCSGCSPPFHPGATPAAAPSSRQGVVPTSIMSVLVTLSLIIIILEVYLLAKGSSGPRFLLDIVFRAIGAIKPCDPHR